MNMLPVNDEDLRSAVEEAWHAFECAAEPPRFGPMPILFFGNLEAYRKATLRVVTVGLNPSPKAFPPDDPFEQFPGCEGIAADDYEPYLDGLCSYFSIKPCSWFNSYERVLSGAEASYYYEDKELSVALHVDIASPVATDPTWSNIKSTQEALLAKGIPLWHRLLNILKPHVVFLSIAEEHLARIGFAPLEDGWKTLCEFESTKDGKQRKQPYRVKFQWRGIMGEPSLFVLGRPRHTSFDWIDDGCKRQVGRLARQKFYEGL